MAGARACVSAGQAERLGVFAEVVQRAVDDPTVGLVQQNAGPNEWRVGDDVRCGWDVESAVVLGGARA